MEDQERRTRSPYLYSRGLPVPPWAVGTHVTLLFFCCYPAASCVKSSTFRTVYFFKKRIDKYSFFL